MDSTGAENCDNKEPDPGGGDADINMEAKQDDFADQIFQLQSIVEEMKTGFTSAIEALGQVQYGDRVLLEKVDHNKAEQEQQLADVVNMVLTLKTEFGGVVSQLQLATDSQKAMQKQVEHLQFERDILLEELETAGAINSSLRERYHSGKNRPNDLHRMNETSLSVLLERARHTFNTSHNTSDHDSGVTAGEVTPPVMSPIIQSYMAGLQNNSHGHLEDVPLEENYDSDSSLTAAANKSLDLSRSLGDVCAEITHPETSDDEDHTEEDEKNGDGMATENKVEIENTHMEQASPSSDTLSSTFKRPMSPRKTPPHERNTKDLFRSRIAKELLDTEKKYCSCLWMILDHFAAPLKQANLVAVKDSITMFPPCLTRMYEHHCIFLQRLEERLTNWRWHGLLGDVVQRVFDSSLSDLLKQYETYINEFPSSLHQIKKSMKHSMRFKRFIRKRQSDPACEGLDLGAYLLTPVQRIPRYVLLFKQLLKNTDPDHPDFFYIDSVVQKLADFLADLNDSIQYSMEVVTGDTTPKLKKKFRSSWRSTSGSSFDASQSSAKDSGILSNGDTNPTFSILQTRMPRLGFGRDQRRHTTTVFPVFPVQSTPISQIASNTSYNNRGFIDSPAFNLPTPINNRERDHTFSTPSSNTLPSRKPNPSRQRRPKSGGVLTGDVRRAEKLTTLRNNSQLKSETDQIASSQQGKPHVVHPLDQSWSANNSFRNPQHCGNNMQNIPVENYEEEVVSTPTNNPVYVDHSYSSNTDVSQYLGASIKSLPEQGATPVKCDPKLDICQSMPGIANNGTAYGIYGDSDDADETLYYPTAVVSTDPNKSKVFGVNQRSKSHGDMIEEGSVSPSQQQIAMSLAKSLTNERLHETDLPNIISSQSQNNTNPNVIPVDNNSSFSSYASVSTQSSHRSSGSQKQKSGTVRPKSAVGRPLNTGEQQHRQRPKSAVYPNSALKISQQREHMWNDSLADNSLLTSPSLNLTINGNSIDRRNSKNKKKNKTNKVLDNLNVTTIDGQKKKGFRDSLKNIFFKKRNSIRRKDFEFMTSTPKNGGNKVVELKSGPDFITVHPGTTAPQTTLKSNNIVEIPPTSHVERTAVIPGIPNDQSNISLNLEANQMPSKMTLSTYQDENGEPCSAV